MLLALARPMEVIEEWTMLDTAPLTEALTARVVYRRDDGPELELPLVFDDDDAPPTVELVGTIAPLAVHRVAGRWRARMPSEPGPRNARVVVRSIRTVRSLRLFQAQWPTPRGEASRRVAISPRGWMQGVSGGWTCADDSVATVACVSIDTAPSPLHFRVPPPTTTLGHRVALAICALVAVAYAVGARSSTADDRRGRAVALVAALIPAVGLALTMVGARLISWPQGLAVACVLASIGAALSLRSKRGTTVASAALVALPLLSVFDGRPATSLVGWLVALVAIAVVSRNRPAKQAAT